MIKLASSEHSEAKSASAGGIKAWLKGAQGTERPSVIRAQESSPPQFDRLRFAILPFSNISPDPNDEYFADGMTEELISTMSKISGLKVIARTSVMGYKGAGQKKISEVAKELEVGTILEGSVRKAGDKLRITVQLVDSRTSDHLWSESYDRELKDVFAIQTDISRTVADALKVQLMPVDTQHLQQQKPTQSTEAYTLYLKGRYFWNQRELDGFNKAQKEFETAIEKDPSFALAYSGLADTHLLLARNGHVSPKFAYPKAIQNAQKAIELDGTLPEPHVAIAAIRQEYEWKWEEAGREFTHAIELNPSNPVAHCWYALYLGHVGRFNEAINEAVQAQQLDPLSPRTHCGASEAYLFARRYDKAIECAERALEINPNFGGAYGYRGYAYVEKRVYDQAIADFQEAGKQLGARAWMGRLGHAYAISGNKSEATKILDALKSESAQSPPKSPFIPPPPSTAFDIGLVYMGLGEKDHAIDWLEKASEERTAEIIHVKCEPIYDSIRDEKRFMKLIKKIGLIED